MRSDTPPGSPAARVLVIEDDVEMAAAIASCLASSGFLPEPCFHGTQGLRLALSGHFDVITLDRMLPGCDGLEIAKAVRHSGLQTPILMLSALTDLDDRLAGLRGGGDDYVIKPFAPEELVVRIEALLRRTNRSQQPVLLKAGDLELDLVAREARRKGRFVELLPTEFKLLEFMIRNRGRMLSRRMIFEHVWEYDFDPGTNLIDVHVGRLRKKIDDAGKASFIRTERGVGYVLDAI
ncbi:MAG: response regulator with CheY-like receiver domain and winged-helix DNA-binding domain [Gammaproteobacteria bacterium]|nr:response regulator with CheY-like receiver domain and winged-helix DNA-binding domain [Gammaproteobacteria bacterium]